MTQGKYEQALFYGQGWQDTDPHTSDAVDTPGVREMSIFLVTSDAGSWTVEAKFGGEWYPLGTDTLTALNPVILDITTPVPSIRLVIQNSASTNGGHVAAILYTNDRIFNTTQRSSELSWITANNAPTRVTV